MNGKLGSLTCEAGVSYTNNFADSDTLEEDFDGAPARIFSPFSLLQGFKYITQGHLSINCRERLEYKADGARETGVYTRVHEDFEHRPTT